MQKNFQEYRVALDKIRDLSEELKSAESDLTQIESQLEWWVADRIAERFKKHPEFSRCIWRAACRMGSWKISFSLDAKPFSARERVLSWRADRENFKFHAGPHGLSEYDEKTCDFLRNISTMRKAPTSLLLREADSIESWLDELIPYLLDLENYATEP